MSLNVIVGYALLSAHAVETGDKHKDEKDACGYERIGGCVRYGEKIELQAVMTIKTIVTK